MTTAFKLTPPEARAALVKALRSGDYEQTNGTLRARFFENGVTRNRHCCLGVACDVFQKIEGKGKWDQAAFEIGGVRSTAFLPEPVQEWLGFIESDAELQSDIISDDGHSLIGLNDGARKNFEQIADVIENDGVKLS